MPAGTQGAMATGPQPISQPSHRGAPVSNNVQQAVSPPSKEQLKSWWKGFGRRRDKSEEQAPVGRGIFGVPLPQSILYANVAISLTNDQGESFIYGYVPIVVAKCGVFLKEKATDVEGIFRLSGSAKRIKDLQIVFNSPERYGKGLDWTGYTVHDAANILRRYLNQLPEPIVPLEFYDRFRDPLRAYQAKVGNDAQAQTMENEEHHRAVTAYQKLITELPALNRQLLLYILDLLAVFASKSDLNRMTAQNLAAIFQPGIISHPSHDMAPNEYRLSQDVLIFLIENQDNFLIGMTGTAMDEKTKDEVKSGPPSVTTPKTTTIGRSASTASAGADSLRRAAGIRRNASLSSRNSRDRSSPGVSSPGTPVSPGGVTGSIGSTGGLGRSNTVPSNRSPAMSGRRFQRISDSNEPSTPTVSTPTPIPGSPPDEQPTANDSAHGMNVRQPVAVEHPSTVQSNVLEHNQVEESPASRAAAHDVRPTPDSISGTPINGRQNRDRKISGLLAKSPIFGPSDVARDPNQRQPRKLQKRRLPGSSNESAQSSQASLHADEGLAFHTPMATPSNLPHGGQNPMERHYPSWSNNTATHGSEHPSESWNRSPSAHETRHMNQGLMPPRSPTASIHSRGSATDPSDLDALDDPTVRKEKIAHRYRWSKADSGPLAPPPPIGQNPGARASNSSLGSNRPRKSFTGESQLTQSSNMEGSSTGYPSGMNASSRESAELLNAQNAEAEKKGFFGRMKAKMQQRSDDKRDRDVERAKSPPRIHPDQANSRSSLSAFAHEHLSPRGRSFDRPREEPLPVVQEKRHEGSGSKTPTPPQPAQSARLSTGMPSSAPVSAVSQQGHTMATVPATQRDSMSAPATAAPDAPSAAPLMAAAPGPVPTLAPAAMQGSEQAEKPVGVTAAEHPQAFTQMPIQHPTASSQPTSVLEQAPAQAPVAEPRPIQEGVQQQLHTGNGRSDNIPSGPRWTKIPKTVVSPEVLREMGEDFEEAGEHVIVKRQVPREEVQELADRTMARSSAGAEATREIRPEQHGQSSESVPQP